ncbi:hypothetical protein N0V90_001961 [Kalmusia sp. IMI 367209]|nr:hypothetical protein N0V90_001961 [Kalmusia sp. IMI 367209]
MRQHASLTKDEETNAAAWEAARGAGWGAAKVSFLISFGVTSHFGGRFRWLPWLAGGWMVYDSGSFEGIGVLTYIQMSGMILGSMIEADKRMIAYEHHVRHQKRLRRDMEVWRRYEDDFERRGTPGVGAESNVKGTDPES